MNLTVIIYKNIMTKIKELVQNGKRRIIMPRKLTDDEIEKQKDYMYQKGLALIKEKGVMNIRLDDITQVTQMAKGSFYRYYRTKEQFLYEVIKRNEAYLFTSTITEKDFKKSFEKYFLSNDFLFAYITPDELEYLLSCLPKEIKEMERNKSLSNFCAISKMFGIEMTQENFSTLSYLMDGLQTILRSPGNYGNTGQEKAAKMVVDVISTFFKEDKK